jgi:putative ABC transport system ATP-binding protein
MMKNDDALSQDDVSSHKVREKAVVAELIGASKKFKSGNLEIIALQKTDLKLRKGELLLIIGPSGSGKTTLISLLGCVLYPTEGCACINGTNTKNLNDRQLAKLRREEIGFVFQNFNLVAPISAEENIMIPLILNKLPKQAISQKVQKALEWVGLGNRRRSIPKQLSGGEQQRVAIARALVSDPSIILCDEPTASLDSRSFEVILQELRSLADAGKAVAVVTHDMRLEKYADRIIHLENGKIVETKEEK